MREPATVRVDIDALRSLHRFGDLYERAIRSVSSELVETEPLRQAKDCIGKHWYGMRVRVTNKRSLQQFYLHTGLIFLPETRTGLMVEVDKKNNGHSYRILWDGLRETNDFEISRAEDEYLKLFMPDAQFDSLCGKSASEQTAALAHFFKACAEAIAETEDGCGFSLRINGLEQTYGLAQLVCRALDTDTSDIYSVEPNAADPDNYGQYASGSRYYLRSLDGRVSMYAYFGAIYSYKKDPAGVFAEIDRHSNPDVFDTVKANFIATDAFSYSNLEPDFIKLFMPAQALFALNAQNGDAQQLTVTAFLHACNTALMRAALAQTK